MLEGALISFTVNVTHIVGLGVRHSY